LDERVKCPECDDMVKHLAQHIRQRHREMKKKHQCPQCEKFFTCGTYLAKHVMRVHMEFRQTCQTCGLETKDLTRHQRMTDCGREGYIPRKLKGTRIKKSKILDTSIESLEPDEIVITEEMKQEIFDSSDEELDIEDDFDEEFEEMKERLDPNTDPEVQPSKITGDVNSRPESAASSIGDRGVSDRMQLRSSSRELEGGNTYTSRGASPVELENDNILLKSEEETPSPGTVMLDHVGSTNNNTHVKMEIRPSPEPVTVLF